MASASKWMAVYKMFQDRIDEVIDIGIEKLSIILPIVKKFPEHLEDFLNKARALSKSDLIKEKKEFMGIPVKDVSILQVKIENFLDTIQPLHYGIADKDDWQEGITKLLHEYSEFKS